MVEREQPRCNRPVPKAGTCFLPAGHKGECDGWVVVPRLGYDAKGLVNPLGDG